MARWVPCQLTEAFETFSDERDSFQNWVIMINVTWVHYFESESKWQSLVWKHCYLLWHKTFKTHMSTRKFLFTSHLKIKTVKTIELLLSLKVKNNPKRRGKLTKGVILLQKANKTIHCLQDLNYELLNHSSYSPPSDFHIFSLLKEAVFYSDEALL